MKSRVIASSAALLLSFSILASACGGSDSGAAAKVNGVELKKSDLLAELKAYKDNKNIDPSALEPMEQFMNDPSAPKSKYDGGSGVRYAGP